jgi:hypothetical protein
MPLFCAVISLALHPDGRTVATGQMGSRPVIHIWDATAPEGKQLIAVLKVWRLQLLGLRKLQLLLLVLLLVLQARTLQRACLYLSFSPDGSKLAAVGQDDDHTLHVFSDWRKVRAFRRRALVCTFTLSVCCSRVLKLLSKPLKWTSPRSWTCPLGPLAS